MNDKKACSGIRLVQATTGAIIRDELAKILTQCDVEYLLVYGNSPVTPRLDGFAGLNGQPYTHYSTTREPA